MRPYLPISLSPYLPISLSPYLPISLSPYLPISPPPHQLHLSPTQETALGSEGIPAP
ncbi:hypothetical protein [Moorena sp. SIO4G3]|uniref:hypothetical protein n=1 Tax=Moorena sp. SIO4G3 TaxID=2607821 RepID=UPI00142C6FF2|nr:hypothetical protein [Moorena sp. SIO4G3]NEO78138.1 hypothetical protein [Moorena sp. SIO4G3]